MGLNKPRRSVRPTAERPRSSRLPKGKHEVFGGTGERGLSVFPEPSSFLGGA